MAQFLTLDLMPVLAGLLCALSCSLIGNFLILTQKSLIADAASHSVVPGIVMAFAITGTSDPLPMFLGAALAAICGAGLTELLRRRGIEAGAALGATFTSLFALGVIALEITGAARAGFDIHHVLFGNLEGLIWPEHNIQSIPFAIPLLASGLLATTGICFLLFKELTLSAFDPLYAETIGFAPRAMSLLITCMAAITAVLAFQAVGAILVLAMMTLCPAAARLCTRSLPAQIKQSLVFATLSAFVGYIIAAFVNLSASGMIALSASTILCIAVINSQHVKKKRGAKNICS